MYRDIYGKLHSGFNVQSPHFCVEVKVFKGADYTQSWGLVAATFYEARGHGREAFDMVGDRLHTLAQVEQTSVLDLLEPTNARSKQFCVRLADAGLVYRVTFDKPYYVREFFPR